MFERVTNEGCKELMELFHSWDSSLETDLDNPLQSQTPTLESNSTVMEAQFVSKNEYSTVSVSECDAPLFDYSSTPVSEGTIVIIQKSVQTSPKQSAASRFFHGIRMFFRRNAQDCDGHMR